MVKFRGGAQIEYKNYGDPKLSPVVLLHSLEYGYVPPPDFVEAAKRTGYCIYTPYRPGYGRSTPSLSIRHSAEILEQFLSTLKLKNVTLVGLSTSAPIALWLNNNSKRVTSCFLVNYSFNAPNKLQGIKPQWLKGLLDLVLGAPERAKFSLRLTIAMMRVIGHARFFGRLYEGCEEDTTYLNDHLDDFKIASDIFLTADLENVCAELNAAFNKNPSIDQLMKEQQRVVLLMGGNTHSVPTEPSRREAEKYGVPFHMIEPSGRNCIFQQPDEVFRLLSAHSTMH